jgi:ubiquitin C-terminal hydrolase
MDIGVCLTEFCREQKLPLVDGWYCPKCKDFREGLQSMSLWLLPDILTLHIKRFNCSARWREKISTKINFPLTGLDMRQWCDKESLARENASGQSTYDLIGVVNHLGGMTGGHYVAACKATPCSVDGSEELAHNFNGAGSNGFAVISPESMLEDQSVWRLPGLGKDKEGSTVIQQSRVAASACARAVSESSEPLWLHFDDDLVEPIPPKAVVSEMAYVLFYRRRELTSSNIARYSTLD